MCVCERERERERERLTVNAVGLQYLLFISVYFACYHNSDFWCLHNQHTMELISTRKKSHKRNNILIDDVPLVEVMYLAFTHMPGESYRRQNRSLLLCLCDSFQALINSLEC